ncbi:hypothetical protein [Halobellus sp. EA9]|uniref:hypothetical protein n=1 Tax=Halobellus sp. EA9 TaxID=3421647 RepID=UPI003EBDF823
MMPFLIQVSGHPIEEKADPAYIEGARGRDSVMNHFATANTSTRAHSGSVKDLAGTRLGRRSQLAIRGYSIARVVLMNTEPV